MKSNSYFFTSESVSEGHPDKVCDRISDMVVDTYLAQEPYSRVACETLTTTNKVILAGETRGPEIKKDELIQKVRSCIKDIGYEQKGFHWKNCNIDVHLHSQSSDIAMGVDSKGNKDDGAGDQGIMFGYACDETEVLMPAPIYYSHKILELMAIDRKKGIADKLEPDSKSQVTMMYENGKPTKVTSVVISTQHSSKIDQSQVKEIVRPYLEKSIPKDLLSGLKEDEFYVNPTGQFIIGGPDGDTGLTGRKIIVDTYGGAAPHGGGAFSGKDPSKVDRSAAYAARYVAKNVVASKIANKCLIQLAYAIGVSKPLSIYVNLFDGNEKKSKHVQELIKDNFDLSPRGIREMLSLNKPIYECTSAYGHFGRKPVQMVLFLGKKLTKLVFLKSNS
jgi:S-adenosylmethionine synthetase